MKKNSKGFTLAELLIVVAIIAVLVAVSIPIFTSKLEKTREATDIANLRAAKAAAVAGYLSEDNGAGTYYYDATNGVLKAEKTGISTYGEGTTATGDTSLDGKYGYDTEAAYTDKIIKAVIASDGTVTLTWE